MRARALALGAALAAACGREGPWSAGVRPSAQLGWEHVPGSAGINSRGARGREPSDPPANGVLRVLAIGDSFLDNGRLAGILESALPSAEFQLGGMTGYGPDQYYLWYNAYGRFLRPNVVLVFWFPGNDLADIARSRNNGGYQKPYFLLTDGALTLYGSPIARPERRFAEEEFTPLVQREWLKLGAGGKPASGDLWYLRNRAYAFFADGDDLERAWRLNEAILRGMSRDIRRDGGRMVLCLAPHPWQVDPESGQRLSEAARAAGLRVDLEAPRRRLSAACRRLGIPILDLTDPLRRLGGRAYDSKHAVAHWSELGMRTVAEAVAGSLKRRA